MEIQQSTGHEASTKGVSVLDGEQVIENCRPSLEVWWKEILVGSLLVLIGLSALASGGVGIILLVGAVVFAYVYVARMRSRYVITDERIIKRVGLLRKSSNEVRIEDVSNLRKDAKIIERILGDGHVEVSTSAVYGTVLLAALPDHDRIANIIREQQR